MEHHGNQLCIVLSGADYKSIQRNGGIAGFAANDVGAVLREILFDHFIARRNAQAFRIPGIGRKLVVGRGGDFAERLVLEGVSGDESHVVGADIVVFIIQTAGIGKVGVHAAQLLCLFVHQLGKGLCGACRVFCQSVCRLVCRL